MINKCNLILNFSLISLVISLPIFSGCVTLAEFAGVTTSESRQNYVKTHPEISKKIKECIINQKITLGMTQEDVIASWGQPSDKNRYVNQYVVTEQWSYHSSYYLYFENGKLKSWQEF